MDQPNSFGLYLFQKDRKDSQVLKDLLQLLKTNFQGKSLAFAYVSAENSLLPNLSLWENLQLVAGHASWKEFSQSTKPEWESLVRLITRPDLLAKHAENWEKFNISLLKGLIGQAHLLIDMNEDQLSPLIIQNLKKTILGTVTTPDRQIYLASAVSSLWFDCAHSIVSRKEYEFITQKLDASLIKRHWVA